MSPPSEGRARASTLPGLWRYPGRRDVSTKGTDTWLADRRDDVKAGALWRVHDTLYDFSGFVERHPGGRQWLELTKGTDITEAFEAHHISPMPSRMLSKFEVRPAETVRNSPYTFRPDGFYATLRRRVFTELPDASMRGATVQSRLLSDCLVGGMVTLALLAASYQSFLLAILAGVLLGMSTIAAHNFIHSRDNWRRYYFDLSMMSSTHWRVSHALSHHLFPNSLHDLEISLPEPLLQWLPRTNKGPAARFVPWLLSPLLYAAIFPMDCVIRMSRDGGPKVLDLIPLLLPAAMLVLTGPGHVVNTLLLWLVVIMSGSFYFGATSINAGHHHPDVFHDGDAPREDMDWGLAQLDTNREREGVSGVRGSVRQGEVVIDTSGQHWWTFFLVLTNFGDHTLHHLFPSLDHSRLSQLYPVLQKTLSEFKVPFKTHTVMENAKGQFLQLARVRKNPKPPESVVRPKK